jgi:malate dehydrogenase
MSVSVAIFGAGPLGGALAHRLAVGGYVRSIRLIDDREDVAAGKALDIQQAGALEPFATRLIASADPLRASGADVVVLADAADQSKGELTGEAALALLKRLTVTVGNAVFVCAGALHRSLVERALVETTIPPRRLVGSASVALHSAATALVALQLDASQGDISLSMVGVPPEDLVVAWNEAAVAGTPLADRLGPVGVREVERRIPHLWPPGPLSLGTAAANVVEAILVGSPRLLPCFVATLDQPGMRGRVVALPVRLGPGGVERRVLPSLSRREEVRFENALEKAGAESRTRS